MEHPAQPTPSFRFRTAGARLLTEEIKRIERVATEQLQNGSSLASVQVGSQYLLRLAIEGARGELVEPAAKLPACRSRAGQPTSPVTEET